MKDLSRNTIEVGCSWFLGYLTLILIEPLNLFIGSIIQSTIFIVYYTLFDKLIKLIGGDK